MNRNWVNSGFNFIIQTSDRIARGIQNPGTLDLNDVYVDICWLNFMAKKMKDRINESNE